MENELSTDTPMEINKTEPSEPTNNKIDEPNIVIETKPDSPK